jgi:hypothetical protein
MMQEMSKTIKPENVLFRASQVGALMVNPRTKKAREAGELSATAKTMIEETFLQLEYGARKPVVTREMIKGHLNESEAIRVLDKVMPIDAYRKLYTGQRKFNDYFIGSCDIPLPDAVEDIKNSYDLTTFFKVRESTIPATYYAQGQVYMDLWGVDTFRLCYVLTSTPEELIQEEEKSFFFKYGSDESEDYLQACEQIRSIHEVDHIPAEHRVKVFTFPRDEEYLTELKSRVEKAREYYATLKLNMT